MSFTTLASGRRFFPPGLIIFLLALALRLLLFQTGKWEPIIIDGYDFIAHNIVEGNGFSYDGHSPTVCRGPVYPALLATVIGITHQKTTPFSLLRVIDSILDALTALLAYLVARRWLPALGRRAHLAAGVAYALNPFAAYFSVKLGAETHQTLVFALYMLFLHRTLTDTARRFHAPLLLGVTGGVLLLSKSVFLPIVAGLPVVFLLSRRFRTRQAIARLAGAVAISLALLVPWAVRNHHVSGRPVLVQTLAGFNFWYDFTMDRNRDAAIASGNLNTLYEGGEVELPDGRAYNPYSLSAPEDAATDALLGGRALQWAGQHPGGMLRKMCDNFLGFWYVVETPKKMLVTAVFSIALLTLALIGYLRARRSAFLEANVLFSLPLVIAFIYSPALGVFRYSLIVYPLLSVLAGAPLAQAVSLVLRRGPEQVQGETGDC